MRSDHPAETAALSVTTLVTGNTQKSGLLALESIMYIQCTEITSTNVLIIYYTTCVHVTVQIVLSTILPYVDRVG